MMHLHLHHMQGLHALFIFSTCACGSLINHTQKSTELATISISYNVISILELHNNIDIFSAGKLMTEDTERCSFIYFSLKYLRVVLHVKISRYVVNFSELARPI